jgi:hypothetical protein
MTTINPDVLHVFGPEGITLNSALGNPSPFIREVALHVLPDAFSSYDRGEFASFEESFRHAFARAFLHCAWASATEEERVTFLAEIKESQP